jgi:hypothetical protein
MVRKMAFVTRREERGEAKKGEAAFVGLREGERERGREGGREGGRKGGSVPICLRSDLSARKKAAGARSRRRRVCTEAGRRATYRTRRVQAWRVRYREVGREVGTEVGREDGPEEAV